MKRRARVSVRVCAFALVSLAVGCSSNSTSMQGGYVCPDSIRLGPNLIVPSPMASGVPTAAASLQLYAEYFGTPVDVLLVNRTTGGSVSIGTIPANAPSPEPSALTFNYAQLASATTYEIEFDEPDLAQGPCPSGLGTDDAFTTQ